MFFFKKSLLLFYYCFETPGASPGKRPTRCIGGGPGDPQRPSPARCPSQVPGPHVVYSLMFHAGSNENAYANVCPSADSDSDLGRLVRAKTRAVHCRAGRRVWTPPCSPFPRDGDERVIGRESVSAAADHRGPGRDVAHDPGAPPPHACVGIRAVQRERRVKGPLAAADVDVDGPGCRPAATLS